MGGLVPSELLEDAVKRADDLAQQLEQAEREREEFRIEADRCMRDYDALELKVGIASEHLHEANARPKIAEARAILSLALSGAVDREQHTKLEQAEHERKQQKIAAGNWELQAEDEHERANKAEQRIEELERALERIASKDHDMRNPWHEALMIARNALSREDSDEG